VADRAAAELQHDVVAEQVEQLVHLAAWMPPDATGMTLRKAPSPARRSLPRSRSTFVCVSRHTL
jgi:hypothetical protein